MDKLYITITGTGYRYGTDFLERGMEVYLEKDHDNEYDSEAIMVHMPGMGKIGYVANSVNTRLGDSISAGRLYDKMGEVASAYVRYILDNGVVCEVDDKDLSMLHMD